MANNLAFGGSAERDTLVTVFSLAGAGTQSWTAPQDLHIIGLMSSSQNCTLGVVGLVTVVQPSLNVGTRQYSPGAYAAAGVLNPGFVMNIAVHKGEAILFNASVACTAMMLYTYDVAAFISTGGPPTN